MEGFYKWCAECGIPCSEEVQHRFWMSYAQQGFGGGYNFGVQELEEDPFKRAGVTKVVLDVLYAQRGRAAMYPVSRPSKRACAFQCSCGVRVPEHLVLTTQVRGLVILMHVRCSPVPFLNTLVRVPLLLTTIGEGECGHMLTWDCPHGERLKLIKQ